MNDNNNDNIRPYKATGNLNTAIGNPSVNINDTMDVNIKNVATNMNINKQINDSNVNMSINNTNNYKVNSVNSNQNNVNQNFNSNSRVNRTYVSVDNRPKKKSIKKINLGSEFKVALLIIVILMVFIFLLPKISEIFRGY